MQTRVAAIVLAAGQSRRTGEQNKLLTVIGDAPMIGHVVRSTLASDVYQVIVARGHDAPLVQQT